MARPGAHHDWDAAARMNLRRVRMNMDQIDIAVDAQDAKAEPVTQEGMYTAIEQYLLGHVAPRKLASVVKALAEREANAFRRILEDLFYVDPFAAFLRRTYEQTINHSAFFAMTRY
jgi:hypothetical protein